MAAVAAWAMDNDGSHGPIVIAAEPGLENGNTDRNKDHIVYGLEWTEAKIAC